MRQRHLVLFLILAALTRPAFPAGDWDAKVASFAAARDGSPLPTAETLRSGDRLEIVPALPEPDRKTYLAFDDGPLNLAHARGIDGAVRIPSALRAKKLELTLEGEGIAPIDVPLRPQGVRQRQVYYIPGTDAKVFTADASMLGAGTYVLKLRIGGELVSEIPLVLIPSSVAKRD